MWKWTRITHPNKLSPNCLLFGGLGKYNQIEHDVTISADRDGMILLAIDTFGDEVQASLTRDQVTALIALLTEALEVTKERME
jgi:hypothetical protein